MQSKLSESQVDFNSSSRLARYYNRCGFKKVTKERSKSILMEVQVHKMKI
jgi:hypothetical protein